MTAEPDDERQMFVDVYGETEVQHGEAAAFARGLFAADDNFLTRLVAPPADTTPATPAGHVATEGQHAPRPGLTDDQAFARSLFDYPDYPLLDRNP